MYQSLVSKRIRAGEDPYPVTFCRQITSTAYESDKREGGTRAALLDLLDHILSSERLSEKEKKKKLKKFKASYPEIYQAKVRRVCYLVGFLASSIVARDMTYVQVCAHCKGYSTNLREHP